MSRRPPSDARKDPPINGITLATLRKLWLAIALATSFFAFVAHGETQGSDFDPDVGVVLELGFMTGTPDAVVSRWGIIILSVMVGFGASVMHEHALRTGPTWRDRYPFRLWDASPSIGIGARAQVVAVVLFTLLPLFALGHFWRIFVREGHLCSDPDGLANWTFLPGRDGVFTWPSDITIGRIFGDHYRLAGEAGGADMCTGATTYMPLVEPVLLLLLSIWAVYFALRAAHVVIRG